MECTSAKGDQQAAHKYTHAHYVPDPSKHTAPTNWRGFAVAACGVQVGLATLSLIGVTSHLYPLIGCAVAALASSLGLYGAHARRRWLVVPAALFWGLFALFVFGLAIYGVVVTCVEFSHCDRDDDPSSCRDMRNGWITFAVFIALIAALVLGPPVYVQVRYLLATHDAEDGSQPMELKSMPMTV